MAESPSDPGSEPQNRAVPGEGDEPHDKQRRHHPAQEQIPNALLRQQKPHKFLQLGPPAAGPLSQVSGAGHQCQK